MPLWSGEVAKKRIDEPESESGLDAVDHGCETAATTKGPIIVHGEGLGRSGRSDPRWRLVSCSEASATSDFAPVDRDAVDQDHFWMAVDGPIACGKTTFPETLPHPPDVKAVVEPETPWSHALAMCARDAFAVLETVHNLRDKPDIILKFNVPPDIALMRVAQRGRIYKQGLTPVQAVSSRYERLVPRRYKQLVPGFARTLAENARLYDEDEIGVRSPQITALEARTPGHQVYLRGNRAPLVNVMADAIGSMRAQMECDFVQGCAAVPGAISLCGPAMETVEAESRDALEAEARARCEGGADKVAEKGRKLQCSGDPAGGSDLILTSVFGRHQDEVAGMGKEQEAAARLAKEEGHFGKRAETSTQKAEGVPKQPEWLDGLASIKEAAEDLQDEIKQLCEPLGPALHRAYVAQPLEVALEVAGTVVSASEQVAVAVKAEQLNGSVPKMWGSAKPMASYREILDNLDEFAIDLPKFVFRIIAGIAHRSHGLVVTTGNVLEQIRNRYCSRSAALDKWRLEDLKVHLAQIDQMHAELTLPFEGLVQVSQGGPARVGVAPRAAALDRDLLPQDARQQLCAEVLRMSQRVSAHLFMVVRLQEVLRKAAEPEASAREMRGASLKEVRSALQQRLRELISKFHKQAADLCALAADSTARLKAVEAELGKLPPTRRKSLDAQLRAFELITVRDGQAMEQLLRMQRFAVHEALTDMSTARQLSFEWCLGRETRECRALKKALEHTVPSNEEHLKIPVEMRSETFESTRACACRASLELEQSGTMDAEAIRQLVSDLHRLQAQYGQHRFVVQRVKNVLGALKRFTGSITSSMRDLEHEARELHIQPDNVQEALSSIVRSGTNAGELGSGGGGVDAEVWLTSADEPKSEVGLDATAAMSDVHQGQGHDTAPATEEDIAPHLYTLESRLLSSMIEELRLRERSLPQLLLGCRAPRSDRRNRAAAWSSARPCVLMGFWDTVVAHEPAESDVRNRLHARLSRSCRLLGREVLHNESDSKRRVGGKVDVAGGCRNIVLLGDPATGKSALGNALLGRRAFDMAREYRATPGPAQSADGTIGGTSVRVVELPGLDGRATEEADFARRFDFAHLVPGGVDVFLLSMALVGGRVTKRDLQVFNGYRNALGDEALARTIIVFTFMKDGPVRRAENALEYCRASENEFLRTMARQVRGIVTVDTDRSDDERRRACTLVGSELLALIEQAGSQKYGEKEAEQARERREAACHLVEGMAGPRRSALEAQLRDLYAGRRLTEEVLIDARDALAAQKEEEEEEEEEASQQHIAVVGNPCAVKSSFSNIFGKIAVFPGHFVGSALRAVRAALPHGALSAVSAMTFTVDALETGPFRLLDTPGFEEGRDAAAAVAVTKDSWQGYIRICFVCAVGLARAALGVVPDRLRAKRSVYEAHVECGQLQEGLAGYGAADVGAPAEAEVPPAAPRLELEAELGRRTLLLQAAIGASLGMALWAWVPRAMAKLCVVPSCGPVGCRGAAAA